MCFERVGLFLLFSSCYSPVMETLTCRHDLNRPIPMDKVKLHVDGAERCFQDHGLHLSFKNVLER